LSPPTPTPEQLRHLLQSGRLRALLEERYPEPHEVRTDRALYEYVHDVQGAAMKRAAPLAKVVYDNRLHVIRGALGTHTTVARVQGKKLKTKREIRVASLFKQAPAAFLRMIVVHELAHQKVREHDKDFYALCTHMEPDYHQLEYDFRLWLLACEHAPEPPAT
jgi:predicted metal-dependent hydrolase